MTGNRFSDEQLQEFYQEFKSHSEEEKRFREAILRAFPEGDIAAHRQGHEAQIRAAKAQETFWQELRLDLVKKGLGGLVVLLLGLVVAGLGVRFGLKL